VQAKRYGRKKIKWIFTATGTFGPYQGLRFPLLPFPYPQLAPEPEEQPQVGSVFRRIPLRMPAAHPTPERTVMAE
jgi:hypothetical protein